MKREIYLNPEGCAVVEDGRLVEYLPEQAEQLAGRILLGRVDRIMASLRCAFVDIGRRRSGFLPLEEDSHSFLGSPVRSGDLVLVQIKKEEIGEKGAFLTRDLTLPGKYLILMPLNRHVGVSGRIQEEADRFRMLETGRRLSGGAFGLVMRASSTDADEEELREELDSLRDRWESVSRGIRSASEPGSVLLSDSPRDQLLNDYETRGITRLAENEPLPADVRRQLREATSRMVPLPHGGAIVIDRCEAMTVIDVNSAGNTGQNSRRQTILQTNLEACDEIARQVRLRNLSGIVITDFINMETEADRNQVLDRLREAFAEDRIKTVIHGYTSLGLMEMTRKRTRPDLYELWMTPCDRCGGSGRLRREKESE